MSSDKRVASIVHSLRVRPRNGREDDCKQKGLESPQHASAFGESQSRAVVEESELPIAPKREVIRDESPPTPKAKQDASFVCQFVYT